MPRIKPVDPATATGTTKELFNEIQGHFGMVPNLMKTLGHSTATLDGFLKFNGALGQGVLDPKLREQIAVTCAGVNQCGYCASAHTFIGGKQGIDSSELAKNLKGQSDDARTQAVLSFVTVALENRGQKMESEFKKLQACDFTEAEIVEIIGHIGMNIFTNYFNNISGAINDFPVIDL